MRPAIALLVIGASSLAAATLPVHAQTTGQISLRDTEQRVVVQGCLDGKRLKPDLTVPTTRLVFEQLDIKELRLEGPKGVMQLLDKEHDGHQDEISGVVLVPAKRDVSVKTGQIGPRTRVTATSGGVNDPRGAPRGVVPPFEPSQSEPGQSLRMRVESVRHLADHCAAQTAR